MMSFLIALNAISFGHCDPNLDRMILSLTEDIIGRLSTSASTAIQYLHPYLHLDQKYWIIFDKLCKKTR